MSGLISGLVLRLPISGNFTSATKFVAWVYADHAWEDGSHAYPSISTVAGMTGYFERTVQRHLRILEHLGILVVTGKGPRGTNCYSFPLKTGEDGSIRLDPIPAVGGVTVTPCQADGGVTDSGVTDSGVTRDTRINNPSVKEEEEEGAEKIEFSQELREKLQQAGVYKPTWPDILARLRNGWNEDDVQAVLNWMRQTNPDPARAAQRAVARIREGSKAPEQYYPLDLAIEPEIGTGAEPEVENDIGAAADGTVNGRITGSNRTPAQVWQFVLSQLQAEMPKESFNSWAKDTFPMHWEDGLLQIGVRNIYAQDWLKSRLTSTVVRLLCGILNMDVSVEFVVADVSTETAGEYAGE